MKITNSSTKQVKSSLVSTYDFDILNPREDLKKIAEKLEKSGMEIDSIMVAEMGDWEDAPLHSGYNSIDEYLQSNDFSGKTIESYTLRAVKDSYNVVVTIYPQINRITVRYKPIVKEEVDSMLDELTNNQEAQKNNSIIDIFKSHFQK